MACCDSDDDYWGQYDGVDVPFFAQPSMPEKRCDSGESDSTIPAGCFSHRGKSGGVDDDFSRQSTAATVEEMKLRPLAPVADARPVATPAGRPSSACYPGPQPSAGAASACGEQVIAGELEVGSMVTMGSRSFFLTGKLGQGSFGTVWCAECCEGHGKVAIKEMFCSGPVALGAAHAEGALLQSLSGDGRRLPALVTGGTESLGPGESRVLLVMSNLPGVPLLGALEGARQELAGRFQGNALGQVEEACSAASCMLQQLAPTMARVSAQAFHRDAHASNILVENLASNERSFGLIDFGLTVQAAYWWQGGWQQHGAAGDGRYWPASAWLHFTQGVSAVNSNEELRREYEMMLDFHSIGMTALQLFATISAPHGSPDAREASRAETAALKLQQTWEMYWKYATHCWKKVLAGLNEGRAADMKKEMSDSTNEGAVHESISCQLEELRSCMRELKLAVEQTEHETAASSSVPILMDVLLRLIGGCDPSLGWREVHIALGGRSEELPPDDGVGPALVQVEARTRSAEDDYWDSDQWDPDERVYVGAETGGVLHMMATLPEDV